MAKNIIHKSNIKLYNPIVWNGRPVWKYYAQLKNHLQQYLGAEYAEMFAEPSISPSAAEGQTDTIWLSESISKNALKITALSSDDRVVYERKLADKIHSIEKHVDHLLKGTDSKEREWGEFLLKCIEIPSYDNVLVEGEFVVLVLWGFKERSSSETFSLKRKVATIIPPVIPLNDDIKSADEYPESEKITVKDEITEQEKNIGQNTEIQETHNDINLLKEDANQFESTQSKENSDKIKKEDPVIIEVPVNNWKRWLWILLLTLLILLLLVLLLRNCKSTSKILPDEPNVLIPVDSLKIKPDKDSLSKIVSDRLNVVIGSKDKIIKDFAETFKKNYPSSKYKIIYYDNTTLRLQLLVPEEEREQLKKDLKSKMPEFKLLIWDEYLFKADARPSDPGFRDNSKNWHHEKIKVFSAWDQSMGDKDLVIAVIDDGFDLSHPELSKNVVKPRNLNNPKASVNIGKTGHGTHVAAIALGLADNDFGVSGIAPNCKLMPLQVADKNGIMSSSAIIDAVLYAINNEADVINMSLGKMMMPQLALYPEEKQEEIAAKINPDEEEFWNQLFQMAYDRGIPVILAGGNQNIIIGLDPMQKTPYTINVSAIDKNNNKASFSNYGRRSSLSAPGVQIYSALPGNKMGPMDGTSMAAPVVSGAVALMKSVNPTFTNKEILEILQNTGLPLSSTRHIGNLIQLDAALNLVSKRRAKQPRVDCPDAQEKIDKLLMEIEKIKDECSSPSTDTFKLPGKGKTNDLSFAKGRWKSTSPLYNLNNGEKVTVFFDFEKNGNGTITLIEENGTNCTANLSFNYAEGNFNINQLELARCPPSQSSYNPYSFECKADKMGNALCIAKNKINKLNNFDFNLIRVNSNL
jgi:hypothetical protein